MAPLAFPRWVVPTILGLPRESRNRIKEAPVGLQLHSNRVPQEVQFKDLVLETFPKEDRLVTVKRTTRAALPG